MLKKQVELPSIEAELLHLSQSVVGIPGLAAKLDRGHIKRV